MRRLAAPLLAAAVAADCAKGNAVIYPRYQDSVVEPPAQVLGNCARGRAARAARAGSAGERPAG